MNDALTLTVGCWTSGRL